MTKDVLVKVRGKQIGLEDEDEIEIINVGSYYERNGKKFIRYEEFQEEQGSVLNMIKLDGKSVEITKKGSVGVQMIFRQGEKVNSCYETPFGNMMMGIYTNSVSWTESEELIEVNLSYIIEMNGEFLSDAEVYIRVEPQDVGKLKLM